MIEILIFDGNLIRTKMKMFKHLFGITFLAFLMVSCGGNNEDKDLQGSFVSLVTNQKDVVGYGYLDVESILNKGNFTSLDGIGSIVESNYIRVANAINAKEKIYYALTGPLERDGMPTSFIVLSKVKNRDSVRKVFTEMGYSFELEKDMLVHYDMTTAIGIDDNFIVMASTNPQGDAKQVMLNAFDNMDKKDRDERITAVIEEETDYLVASHLQNLYETSSTSLSDLPEEQQKEIEAMVENSHVSTSLTFGNGELVVHANTSRVSEAMKKAYFFKEDGAGKVAQSIGPGKPIVAMAGALDIAKMEEFLNRFSPNATKQLYKKFGLGGFFLQAMGPKGVSSLFSGDIGFNLLGVEDDFATFGGLATINGYLGFGENGANLKDLIHSYAENGQVEDLEGGYYKMDEAIGYVTDNELFFHSNDSVKERFRVEPITKVDGMNDFGVEPVSFYVDMKQISSMNLTNMSQAEAMLELADYLTLNANPDGITLRLSMKNQSENVLLQIVNAAAEQFKSQISLISM